MSFHYQLWIADTVRGRDYSSFAEASRAIAASAGRDDEWELVRTDDRGRAWTLVLSGAGAAAPGSQVGSIRHYPPGR